MGQEYVISGELDPDYVRSIAKYVDDRMREIQQKTVGISSTRLAVLTAMNIADELLALRNEVENAANVGVRRLDEIENKIMTCIRDIESPLDPQDSMTISL